MIPSLDGIRAIAVLIVLPSHTGFGGIVPGRTGVTIFFFLSGYLITTLMLREFEKKGTIELRKFFARRFLRLLPPLLLTLPVIYLLAAVGVVPGGSSWRAFLSHFFYFANYFEIATGDAFPKPRSAVVLWSLAIEEHFYVVYPLMMLPLLRFFSYRKIIGIFVGLCGVALSWRVVLASEPDFIFNRTAFGTDTRFDSILFGCILGLTQITEKPSERVNSSEKISPAGMALFGASVVGFIATLAMRDIFIRETIRYSIQGLALMPIFYYAIVHHEHFLFRPLNSKVLTRVGVLSYVIYLTHYTVYFCLVRFSNVLAESKVFTTLLTFGFSVVVAEAIDRGVDEPTRRLRKRLR